MAAAVGQRLVMYLEQAPGAERPRDFEHLRRQQLVVREAAGGGWRALPEEPVDLFALRSRSIDVLLTRLSQREAAAVEVWDWFADLGEAMRGLDAKVGVFERHLNGASDAHVPSWRVGGLWAVRRTRRNKALAREFGDLLAAKSPTASGAWLRALRDPASASPDGHGFVWTDTAASRLVAARLGRGHNDRDGAPRRRSR